MRKAARALLPAFLCASCGVAPPAPPDSMSPEPWPLGTYRLRVCRGSCVDTPADSVLSAGTLVLLPRELTTGELKGLEPTEIWSPRPRTPNACFRFDRTTRPPRTMAGIIRMGATRWATVGDSLYVELYGSVDASFHAALARSGQTLNGTGVENFAGMKESTMVDVMAERTGPADARLCHDQTAAR